MDLSAADEPAMKEDSDDGFPDPVGDDDEEPAKTETEQLSEAMIESLLEELGRLKDAGNSYFKAGANEDAVSAYADAVKMSKDGGDAENFQDAVKPILLSLHNNSAAAQLKLEAWAAAAESASSAIELDGANAKALYRRGVARSRLGMHSSAKDDLMASCKADPKNKDARTELATVQAAIKTANEAHKMSFAEKFGAASEKAVAKEEAKEAARKREEAKVKAAAEEALKEEWKAECARLREVQRNERETARLARLRKFMGEAGAADVSDAPAPNAPAARDVSEWARRELRERLEAVDVELDDVIVSAGEGSVKSLEGWANVTATAKGMLPSYELSAEVRWTCKGRADPRQIGAGTLSYTAIVPGSLGGITFDVAETVDDTAAQVNPATPPGRAEAEKSRTTAALVDLKEKMHEALQSFGAALEKPPAADSGDAAAGGASREEMLITFESFKEQREKAKKDAEEREESERTKAKDAAAEERRRARKEEKIKVDDAELSGMKGYKTRADGSKTSYFTRELDEQTKALLDEQKKPKRLSVGAAPAAAEGPSVGSAWNANGATWEDKDCSEWAKAELERRLDGITAEGEGVQISVSKVKDVEGTASVVATRGTIRHLFDYGFELEYRVNAIPEAVESGEAGEGGEAADADAKPAKAKSVSKGALKYSEVTAATSTSVEIGGVEHTIKSKALGGAAQEAAAQAVVVALKGSVRAVLESFDEEFKATKKI